SAFILGGLITWQIESWIVTVAVTGVICLIYFFIGRKYINKWMMTRKTKTNIDTIIGKTGIVLQSISKHVDGLVKVGHEEWRARSEEDIEKGIEIVVTDIKGVTLIVKINKGGG
ncbi:MAG: NfeD family protein, partial [Chloroflexi bacterium]|nr:NfeD family protein [Chloroflexota bacterium]